MEDQPAPQKNFEMPPSCSKEYGPGTLPSSSPIGGGKKRYTRIMWRSLYIRNALTVLIVTSAVMGAFLIADMNWLIGSVKDHLVNLLDHSSIGRLFNSCEQAAYNLIVLLLLLPVLGISLYRGALSRSSLLMLFNIGPLRRITIQAAIPAFYLAMKFTYLHFTGGVDFQSIPNQLLIGISEEVGFRCLVLGVIEDKTVQSWIIAVSLSSILFGVLHVVINYGIGHRNLELVIRQALSAFGMGLTFGALRLGLGVTWPVAVLHALFNLSHPSPPGTTGVQQLPDAAAILPLIPDREIVFSILQGVFCVFIVISLRQIFAGKSDASSPEPEVKSDLEASR